MATQEEFHDRIWQDLNRYMQEQWIDNVIAYSEQDPNAPFADVGPALKRLLALGASRRDLSLIARHAAYEQAFTVLEQLEDPGIDDNEFEGLHEGLLGADPSGKEGRPGSAPELKPVPKGKLAKKKKDSSSSAAEPKKSKRKVLKGCSRVFFSPDGSLLAGLGRGLTLWKCPEIEQIAKISTLSNTSELAFSPDSRLIAIKNTSGRIALIDVAKQSITADFRNQSDGEGSNILFTEDGENLVDASWAGWHFVRSLNGTVTFRERFNGEMVTAVFRHPDGTYWFRQVRPDERLIGRTWPFKIGEFQKITIPVDWRYEDAAFSPDGRVLAISAGYKPRCVSVFSFPAMEILGSEEFPSLGNGLCGLGFSPCGRLLVVVGDVIAVLNAATLAVIEEIPFEDGARVAFSPTDPLLAIGGASGGELFDTTRFLEEIR